MTTSEQIIKTVAQHFKITEEQLKSRTNKQEIVEPRQLAMTLIKFGLQKSHRVTGLEVGKFDHATVINGINRVNERYTTYPRFKEFVVTLVAELFPCIVQQEYILDRIADPSLDRTCLLAGFRTKTDNRQRLKNEIFILSRRLLGSGYPEQSKVLKGVYNGM